MPPESAPLGTKPDTTSGFSPATYVPQPAHRDAAEAILRLDGEVAHARIHPDFLERLRRRAASLNTHSTTRIEGNPLTRQDVEEIAGSPQPSGREPPERREVRLHLGYFDSLANDPPKGPVTLEEARATHARLLTGVLSAGVGEWKVRQNVVVDDAGREVFYPTPPARVARELERLGAWFEESPLPTPIRVAIWFHEFECIHPFADGNGRVGRALTHRLLLSNGLPGMGTVALDAQFLADRAAYHRAIAAVQTPQWDHAPWVGYFLACLRRAYEESLDVLRGFWAGLEGFDGLPRAILGWVIRRGGGSFKRAEFLESPERGTYHEVSVSNALTALARSGYLAASGKRRGRSYRPGPRFRELVSPEGVVAAAPATASDAGAESGGRRASTSKRPRRPTARPTRPTRRGGVGASLSVGPR